MNEARHDETKHAPFDTARLDTLLEDEGIDVLVATSNHNGDFTFAPCKATFLPSHLFRIRLHRRNGIKKAEDLTDVLGIERKCMSALNDQ